VLNNLCAANSIGIAVLFEPSPPRIAIECTANGELLATATKAMVTHDKSYAKHKAALAVLKQLAATQTAAFDALQGLLPSLKYRAGVQFPRAKEGQTIEFKGGKSEDEPQVMQAALQVINKQAGKYICAWLNSRVDGQLFIGVHDKRQIITGIKFEKPDDQDTIQKAVDGLLNTSFSSHLDLITFRLHQVFDNDAEIVTLSTDERSRLSPAAKRYIEALERRCSHLESDDTLFLLELSVTGTECNDVEFYDKAIWKKTGSGLRAVSNPAELATLLSKQQSK
jgi:hypothetical protein